MHYAQVLSDLSCAVKICLTWFQDLEHQTGPDRAAQPSKCTLPILHEPLQLLQALPGGTGYISRDGHHFACVNPALLQQSFHM